MLFISHLSQMYGVKYTRRMQASIDVIKLYAKQLFIIFGILEMLFFSTSSDTTLVAARFMPEVAIVTVNIYIDIIRPYIPIVLAPILFAR